MITIDLNQVRETVEVTIGDHVFNVRRMGSGEELELSASNRRTVEFMDKAMKLQKKFLDMAEIPEDKIDQKQVAKLTKEMDKITNGIQEEQDYQSEAFVKLFDDGGDGSKSRELLKTLSNNEKNKLIQTIFEQKAVLDSENKLEGAGEA